MKSILVTLLFVLSMGTISAQTTEGQISYKLDFSSDNPEMAMALPMMQGSTMELYFAKDKSAANVTMGSMMTMKSVVDVKLDKGIILVDAMGQKIATKIESVKNSKKKVENAPMPQATSETKSILGFTCTKYIAKDTTGAGEDFIFWVTKELKTSLIGQEQFNSNIDGVPLEFSTMQQGMKVHFIATDFKKTVDANVFKIDVPEGYRVMTEDQIKGMGM